MEKQLADLESKLEAYTREAEMVKDRLAETEAQLKALQDRQKALRGSAWQHGGLISSVKSEIEKVKRVISDRDLSRPVFTRHQEDAENYRITKVTPKLIFMRPVGSESESRIKRYGDTFYVSYYGLDIEATIKAFEQHQRSQNDS